MTPNKVGGLSLPARDDTHTVLLQSRDAKWHPARAVLALRTHVDGLSETSAVFDVPTALDGSELTFHSVSEWMMHLIGSWESPIAGNRKTKWVNPEYGGRQHHSDVFVHCECGTRMSRVTDLSDDEDTHDVSCTKQNRLRARARLCEKRRDALVEGLKAGQSGRSMADRLGLSDSIGETANDLGVDVDSLKEDFKERRKNTLLHLLVDFCATEAGRVYGISGSRVREIVACETMHDVGDFTSLRRRRNDV